MRKTVEIFNGFQITMSNLIVNELKKKETDGEDFYNNINFILWLLINENLKSDIKYFEIIDVNEDYFDFPVIQRNIRNSIEIFYDMLILTLDANYGLLLEYNSTIRKISDSDKEKLENNEEYKDYLYTYDCYGKERPHKLTIKEKGKIIDSKIKQLERIDDEVNVNEIIEELNKCKEQAIKCNSYIHPDFLTIIPPNGNAGNKYITLFKLLLLECNLFAYVSYFFSKSASIDINIHEMLNNLKNELKDYFYILDSYLSMITL